MPVPQKKLQQQHPLPFRKGAMIPQLDPSVGMGTKPSPAGAKSTKEEHLVRPPTTLSTLRHK